jgi:hypothetical protein
VFLIKEDVNRLKLKADHLIHHNTRKEIDGFHEELEFITQDLNVLIEQSCLQGHFLEFKQEFSQIDNSIKLMAAIEFQ